MRILFVDDEIYFMVPYVQALERVAEVCVVNDAAEAVDKIKTNAVEQQYHLLILDVMMPSPRDWEARTANGLLTGVEVLIECQDAITAVNLPVLILTNHRLEEVKSRVAQLGLPQGLVEVRAKLGTPARMVATLVKQILDERERPE